MKKRVMLGIACGAVAAIMCASFAACGGTPDPKTFTSEKVESAEDWVAAFDIGDNYKAVCTREVTMTDGDASAKIDEKYTFTVTAEAVHVRMETKVSGDETLLTGYLLAGYKDQVVDEYYALGETTVKYYQDEDGTWVTGKGEPNMGFDEMIQIYGNALTFETYEYSEEHLGYVSKLEAISGEAPLMKFRGGKIFCFLIEMEYEGNKEDITYVFEIGSQSVKLPAVTPAE